VFFTLAEPEYFLSLGFKTNTDAISATSVDEIRFDTNWRNCLRYKVADILGSDSVT